MNLGFYTVPIVIRIPGCRMAVHYTTAVPCQIHWLIPCFKDRNYEFGDGGHEDHCLFGPIIAFLNIWGHIRTVPACSSSNLTMMLPQFNAMLQTQDMTTPTHYSKQTQGRPVFLLSIDVECYTWNHKYPF